MTPHQQLIAGLESLLEQARKLPDSPPDSAAPNADVIAAVNSERLKIIRLLDNRGYHLMANEVKLAKHAEPSEESPKMARGKMVAKRNVRLEGNGKYIVLGEGEKETAIPIGDAAMLWSEIEEIIGEVIDAEREGIIKYLCDKDRFVEANCLRKGRDYREGQPSEIR